VTDTKANQNLIEIQKAVFIQNFLRHRLKQLQKAQPDNLESNDDDGIESGSAAREEVNSSDSTYTLSSPRYYTRRSLTWGSRAWRHHIAIPAVADEEDQWDCLQTKRCKRAPDIRDRELTICLYLRS
jgi:hypothetical protein